MTAQPVVPDGMVMIDGKLEKKAELNRQQKLENLLIYNYVTFGYFLQSIVWYWKLCLIQWQKRRQFPQFPVVLELFGDNPASCIDVLKSYGVYACGGSMQWRVVWNKVNLRLLLLVSKSQWEFADNILAQTGGDDCQIVSNPGSKRGQALPHPYSQRQPSQAAVHPTVKRQVQAAKPKQAKLGQRYG